MNPVKNPLRSYDVLSVVGLLVLVAWVPVFMAQEPPEREAVQGKDFVLPQVRYGDRIELEIIVQHEAHAPSATGTVAEIVFRKPRADDQAPPRTILVEERMFPAQKVDLGAATLTQNGLRELRFYGPDGDRIGLVRTEHTRNPSWAGAVPAVGEAEQPVIKTTRSPVGSGLGTYMLPQQEERVVYESAPTWSSLKDIIWFPEDDAAASGEHAEMRPRAVATRTLSDEEQETAPFAAWHQGRILYAKHYFEDFWGTAEHRKVHLGVHDLDLEVVWKDPVRVDAPMERWSWFAEDAPMQVGEHHGFRNVSTGLVYTVDLVPKHIERGTTEVAFEPDPTTTPEPNRDVQEVADDPAFDDPTPLVGAVSLEAVGGWLEGASAPATVRDLMERGAMPGGVAWRADGADVDILVGVVHDRTLRVAEITFDEEGLPQIRDVCDEILTWVRFTIRPACEVDAPTPYAPGPERSAGPAPAQVEELRQGLGHHGPLEGVELGVWTPAVYRELAPHEGRGQRLVKPFPGMPTQSFAHTSWNAAFLLRTNDTASVSIAATGDGQGHHVERHELARDMSSYGDHKAIASGQPVEPPRIIRPLGPEPAYGGLALVVLGLLIRFVAGVKAGAHLPIAAAFYAKITRDKALDHQHRETIHEIVASDPGVTIEEVVERVGLTRTGTFHHLETLVKNDLLKVTTIGRTRHYFTQDHVDPKARMRRAVGRHDDWESVLRVVEASPGVPLQELVAQMARSKTSVSRVGTRLSSLGLVQKRRSGRTVLYYPLTPSASPSADRAPSDRAETATSRVP